MELCWKHSLYILSVTSHENSGCDMNSNFKSACLFDFGPVIFRHHYDILLGTLGNNVIVYIVQLLLMKSLIINAKVILICKQSILLLFPAVSTTLSPLETKTDVTPVISRLPSVSRNHGRYLLWFSWKYNKLCLCLSLWHSSTSIDSGHSQE